MNMENSASTYSTAEPSAPFTLWVDVIEPLADIVIDDVMNAVGAAVFNMLSPARTHGTLPTAGVKIASDDDVQTLNRDFRDMDKPTNVLSFPSDDEDALDSEENQFYLGDIILAVGTLIKEAEAEEKPVTHHLAHLAVHGLLHLMGFDHETDADAEVMEALEIKILAEMNIPNPYQ